ncbi:BBSome complex member BBS1 isoform X1 [Procambarus clarkii]|uniref:BBSome complex member BBS1 isoform X1 n=1 Tax=Procambarus clarkii TaxID=6728 RepID=UPI001E674C0A|nr:Bardet-Biedl syndrome 1 protein-like isoform X1 [Procambarus clarkii]
MAENERWLTAHHDPLAALYTFSACVALADLHGDGESKLIIADLGTGAYNMKLKVYKGTSLMSENTLIDLPTGVITFHMDTTEPRVPAVAVASGSYIYIYKNLRPYFKFTLPTLEVNSTEYDAWGQARDEQLDVSMLYEILDSLRQEVGECGLTTRSQRFLMCPDHSSQAAFLNQHKGFNLKRQTVVTCFATMKKSHAEDDAISCLVLGTESANIFILDPEAFTILNSMSLHSVPVFLSVSGLYDVEYRIIVACRNGQIYTLKRGTKIGRPTAELTSQPVGLLKRDKSIIVATMDQNLHSFNNKGKRLWSLRLPAAITCVETLEIRTLGLTLTALGMADNRVMIYRDKHLVDTIHTEDRISAMKFGRFGREDNTLVLVMKGGALLVKILKRTARFEIEDTLGSAHALAVKLNIPKKTKLFVDQTMRERENCVLMHRVFQHDLYRLRLNTARAYVQALETSSNPVSLSQTEPLKLSAQVLGLGPTFKLRVELQNTSSTSPSLQLAVIFHCDDRIYNVNKSYIQIPILIPGVIHVVETLITCISELGISDTVRVFVVKGKASRPLLTAVINMPVAEVFMGS